MAEQLTLEKLKNSVGKEVAVSSWFEVDQARVNTFADCTDDHQWIHVDPVKAKDGPFKTTIAHGFLTLSLLSHFHFEVKVFPSDIKLAVNYGLNKVRFLNPVTVGSKIRARFKVLSMEEKGHGRILMTLENTIEAQGADKPAMIAETLTLLFV
ncbi:MAG: MaoC family dehydratase [bacterium]|nr:MaoC family dehydratase [bacterium]